MFELLTSPNHHEVSAIWNSIHLPSALILVPATTLRYAISIYALVALALNQYLSPLILGQTYLQPINSALTMYGLRSIPSFVSDLSRYNDYQFLQRCINAGECQYISPGQETAVSQKIGLAEHIFQVVALASWAWPFVIIYAIAFDMNAWRLYGSFDVQELYRTISYMLQVGNDEFQFLLTIGLPLFAFMHLDTSNLFHMDVYALAAYAGLELALSVIPYATYLGYALLGPMDSSAPSPFWFE